MLSTHDSNWMGHAQQKGGHATMYENLCNTIITQSKQAPHMLTT
jgi:hypothetical protein